MSELSERDRWMYAQGYQAGAARGPFELAVFSDENANRALEQDAADGVTVEMVLAKDAPPALKWTTAAPSEPVAACLVKRVSGRVDCGENLAPEDFEHYAEGTRYCVLPEIGE